MINRINNDLQVVNNNRQLLDEVFVISGIIVIIIVIIIVLSAESNAEADNTYRGGLDYLGHHKKGI